MAFIGKQPLLCFKIGKDISILHLAQIHASRCTHRTQSFDKRCPSSPRYFTDEMTLLKTSRSFSCMRKPLASAFSAQVGWGRRQFHSPLSNCLLSRNGFRVETVFGCLLSRRRRQHSSSRSGTSNYRYLPEDGDKQVTLEKIISELNTSKQPRLILLDNFETP